MKRPKSAGLLIGGLTLALIGCDSSSPSPAEPAAKAEHEPAAKAESPAAPKPFYSPVPPVEPSPLPEMPSTAKGDMSKKAVEPARVEPPK